MTVSAAGSGGTAVLGTVFGGAGAGAGAAVPDVELPFTGGGEIWLLVLFALLSIIAGFLLLGLARRHAQSPTVDGALSPPRRLSLN